MKITIRDDILASARIAIASYIAWAAITGTALCAMNANWTETKISRIYLLFSISFLYAMSVSLFGIFVGIKISPESKRSRKILYIVGTIIGITSATAGNVIYMLFGHFTVVVWLFLSSIGITIGGRIGYKAPIN